MTDQLSNEAYLIIEKAIAGGNLEQALKFASARVRNVPGDPYGPFWVGVSLLMQRRFAESCIPFKRALAQDPKHHAAMAYLAYAKLNVCDWDGMVELKNKLFAATEADFREGSFRFVDPFVVIPLEPPLEFQKQVAMTRSKYFFETRPTATWKGYTLNENAKLRIGYLSLDYDMDIPGILLRYLFPFHDADGFEIYCFSLKSPRPDVKEQLEKHCDQFVDFTGIADFEIAKRIRAAGIQILVDLTCFGELARPRVLAMQPAPIQCHCLGHPGTLGADYIQHYITSEFLVPESARPYFTEKLHFIPNTAFALAPLSAVNTEVIRDQMGLPLEAFVFAALYSPMRIDERLFLSWMEILKACDTSILWLLSSTVETNDNLRGQAESYGVSGDRLYFITRDELGLPWNVHVADLWLDSFTFSSPTSVLLSIWKGVPVLTWKGDLPQQRVAANCCQVAEVSSLVVNTVEEYTARAIDLYHNPDQLVILRKQLLDKREHNPLFHPEVYMRGLEQVFKNIWQEYVSSQ